MYVYGTRLLILVPCEVYYKRSQVYTKDECSQKTGCTTPQRWHDRFGTELGISKISLVGSGRRNLTFLRVVLRSAAALFSLRVQPPADPFNGAAQPRPR